MASLSGPRCQGLPQCTQNVPSFLRSLVAMPRAAQCAVDVGPGLGIGMDAEWPVLVMGVRAQARVHIGGLKAACLDKGHRCRVSVLDGGAQLHTARDAALM